MLVNRIIWLTDTIDITKSNNAPQEISQMNPKQAR